MRVKTISARITHLRELARPPVTARELDRLTGLREGHVAMLETRGNRRIEARTLFLIAEVFGCSMEWLYAGKAPAPDKGSVAMPVARARQRRRRRTPRAQAPEATKDDTQQPTGT